MDILKGANMAPMLYLQLVYSAMQSAGQQMVAVAQQNAAAALASTGGGNPAGVGAAVDIYA